MTPPKCACCNAPNGPAPFDLQRVKLTYLCRDCVRLFVAAFARAGAST